MIDKRSDQVVVIMVTMLLVKQTEEYYLMLSNVQRVIISQHTACKMNSGGFLQEKERSLETLGERVSPLFPLWG